MKAREWSWVYVSLREFERFAVILSKTCLSGWKLKVNCKNWRANVSIFFGSFFSYYLALLHWWSDSGNCWDLSIIQSFYCRFVDIQLHFRIFSIKIQIIEASICYYFSLRIIQTKKIQYRLQFYRIHDSWHDDIYVLGFSNTLSIEHLTIILIIANLSSWKHT